MLDTVQKREVNERNEGKEMACWMQYRSGGSKNAMEETYLVQHNTSNK